MSSNRCGRPRWCRPRRYRRSRSVPGCCRPSSSATRAPGWTECSSTFPPTTTGGPGVTRYRILARQQLRDGAALLRQLRIVKDDLEVAVLTRAARISMAAMSEAAQAIAVGVPELDLECLLWKGIRSRGGEGWAYDPL